MLAVILFLAVFVIVMVGYALIRAGSDALVEGVFKLFSRSGSKTRSDDKFRK